MVGTGTGGIQMDRGAFVTVPTLVKAQRGRGGREETNVAGVEESS